MRAFIAFFALISSLIGGTAAAQLAPVDAQKLGFADPRGLLFGEAATREAEQTFSLALGVGFVMVIISLFVLALLLWVAFRYNRRANPEASNTTHSTVLEVLWTGIPTIIVVVIGFLGVRQIIEFERIPALGMIETDGSFNEEDTILDINVYGMPSWNWEYELTYFGDADFAAENPDFYDAEVGSGFLATDGSGGSLFRFASNMLEHPDFEKRSPVNASDVESVLATWEEVGRNTAFYQFDVDNRLVIPSGVRVNVNIQGPVDGIQHAWAVPAFGVKRDFWPGRVNSSHFFVNEGSEGLYFGQCSEFCGPNHAYMPIAVHVVTLDEFRDYFQSQMAAALAAAETGGLFLPEYLPVNLPAPFANDTALAQR